MSTPDISIGALAYPSATERDAHYWTCLAVLVTTISRRLDAVPADVRAHAAGGGRPIAMLMLQQQILQQGDGR